MPRVLEGQLSAEGFRFGIIVSRFNDFISSRLVDGAMDALMRHGGKEENLEIVRVPGSFEIPLLAKRLASSGRFDAVICLGALIRGGTIHFDVLSAEVTKGVAQAGLETDLPEVLSAEAFLDHREPPSEFEVRLPQCCLRVYAKEAREVDDREEQIAELESVDGDGDVESERVAALASRSLAQALRCLLISVTLAVNCM